jgi:hypothetical protein
MLRVSRELNDKSMSVGSPTLFRLWDDLDPSLVHRLQARGLHLGILVWDGRDGVVPPAVDDLVGMCCDDDLVDQHLGQRAPVLCRQILSSQ